MLGNIVGASSEGHVPTVFSYSLGIQRELFKGMTVDVAYVGNVGRHLVTSRDINAIPYGYAFTLEAQDPNACGWNGTVGTDPNLMPEYAAAGYKFSGICALGRNAYSNAPLVPYKGYDQIAYLQFDGTSNYNSLQISLQRRYSQGLTFGLAYTYSKALTTANSDQDTQDPFNARALGYRAAGWDRAHVFAANYVYDLPKVSGHMGGSRLASTLLDHWQLSGVVNFMTGTPIDLNNGWIWEPGTIDGSNMWGAIPYYYTLDKNQNPIFPLIGSRILGTRDGLRTGGMQNWDTSLFKNIPLGSGERYSIQLRLETFNTFNHPNFDGKNYNFDVDGPWQWQPGTPFSISKSANWGTYANTYGGVGGARVVQLGAKFNF